MLQLCSHDCNSFCENIPITTIKKTKAAQVVEVDASQFIQVT